MTKEELQKIIEAVQAAYQAKGKSIETAILIQPGQSMEEGELLIDNRDKEKIQ